MSTETGPPHGLTPRANLRSVTPGVEPAASPLDLRPRVLVVDDDASIRSLCAINLENAGLSVLEAADGRLALEHARFGRPDLIVTDVNMPGLDGFQLAAELRRSKRTREIPIIFLTGEDEAIDEKRARELDAVGYVTKPFDPQTFASLVVRWLAPWMTSGGPTTA
jgi:CheY-like chemotaxis protein